MIDKETRINKETNLKTYFHDTIRDISSEKNVDIKDHTLWYLTNLLTRYSRSERFFDFRPESGTFTPLAEYYKQALDADSDHERRLHLQRLGDVAIFVAGLFAPALNRSVVGVNYYMSMGETAYSYLADSGGATARDKALTEIFDDLARRFGRFVSILSEINGPGPEVAAGKWDKWFEQLEPVSAERQFEPQHSLAHSSVIVH